MKRFLVLFCSVALFFSPSLFAEEDDGEEDELLKAISSFYPISIEGTYFNIGRASFRDEEFENHHLYFSQAETAFGFTCPLSRNWGLIFGSGWVGNVVHMTDNPEFNKTHFSYVTFSLGSFTRICTDWIWSVFFEMSLDTEKLDLGNYTLYDGVLWGQYTLCPYLDFTFGMVLELGLNKTQAWPIAGLSYAPTDRWKINFVYPTNISLEYEVLPTVTAAGAIRFIRTRHRVGGNEPNPFSIFEYRTVGTEFDLTYEPVNWFWITGFVGSSHNGDLKVTNSDNKHGTHFKFKGAFYGGASAEMKF